MPSSSTAIQRPDLGAIAFETMTGANNLGFIGQDVLPIFETPIQSAEYPVINTESLLKIKDTARNARGNYNRSAYQFDLQNYSCQENGWEEALEDSESALYSRFFSAEQVAVERAMQVIMRGYESRVATLTQAVGSSATTNAAAVVWSTAATATPKADVDAAKIAQRAGSGVVGNALVMSWQAFQELTATNEVRTYLQYTSPHLMQGIEAQRDTMARYLGVDRILVGSGIKDSAKKGQSTVIANVWSDIIVNLVKLSSGGNDLREPSFGRTFLWTDDSPSILTTESYRDEPVRSDIYRVRHHTDEAIQFTGANHRITGI